MKVFLLLLGVPLCLFANNGKSGNANKNDNDEIVDDEDCCKGTNIKSCKNAQNIVKNKKIQSKEDINIQGIKLAFSSTVEPNGYVYKNEEGDEAVFTFLVSESEADVELFGSLKTKDGRSFALEKCKRRSVWMEYDVANFEAEELNDVGDYYEQANASSLINLDRNKRQIDPELIVTFSVMVYYTNEFAAVTPNIEGFVNQVIAETNQGYINSEMPIRVGLFCIKSISMSDAGKNGAIILDEFRASFINHKQLLNTADSAVLLTDKSSGAGRVIKLCTACHNDPQAGQNIAYVRKDVALGHYTFGHELGHMFGAGHDKNANGGWTNVYYPYGYGIHLNMEKYRTIMAYSPGRRMNRYSDGFNNITANNKRVIRNNRFVMASNGDESGYCFFKTGCITSSNFPSVYNNKEDKEWTILAPSNNKIEFTFDYFNIESPSVGCAYDWVTVEDGNGQELLPKSCGTLSPADFESKTNQATVKFHTDATVVRKGFQLKYRFSQEKWIEPRVHFPLWGSWRGKEECPYGHYVNRVQLKIEGDVWGDDTALNQIQMTCTDGTVLNSGYSGWGNWKYAVSLESGEWFTGVKIRTENKQGDGDDTAANGLKFRTNLDNEKVPGEGFWGDWSSWKDCPTGWRIVGLQTKVQGSQGNGDDTALNEARFLCKVFY